MFQPQINRRYGEYLFDGLALIAGLVISIPCFIVLTAPLWGGLWGGL